jgi:protocatechuate 3,4-dioxygenase beta subunit
MKRVALATVILSAVALTAQAQQTVRVSGRVLNESGEPIANARVTIIPATPGAPVVLTDGDGNFTFQTPPGRLKLTASKTGYGHRESNEMIAAAQPVEMRLQRGAAISGRVVDGHGDPILDVRVVAEIAATTGTGFTVAAATQTDDRGEYRLSSLAPDTFRVAAITRGEVTLQERQGGFTVSGSVVKTYYPDAVTIRADAAPIATTWPDAAEALRLGPGEDRPSIDFVVPGGQPGFLEQQVMMTSLGLTPAPASAARPTGIVRGRVVTTDGRAVPRAQVRLLPMPPTRPPGGAAPPRPVQPSLATADDDGRFEFRELAAGSLRLAAVKTGYSTPGEAMSFGLPPLMSGLSVDLADGEIRERADLTLARWGTLAGRVFDELGDPVQGVSVQLLQVQYQAGRRRLVAAGGASRVTDDLGRFRTFGIAPGQYIVSAAIGDVASADIPGYTRSYFPGTASPGEAQFVSVGVSQDVTSIDFSLSRERTALVSGTLLDASGSPSTQGSVRLLASQRSASVAGTSIGARLTSGGRFEFPNVTPGQYVIQVDRGRKNSSTEGEFGALPVAVDGVDLTDLVLQTSIGSSISGRVTFDAFGGTTPPRPGQIDITTAVIDPEQSPAAPANADVHADWSFEIKGVNGPRRLRLERAPAEWTLREILVRGIDVTDRPLAFGKADQSLADVEIVLTDRVNTVSGTIVDDRGRPAAAAKAIVFSPDRDRWYPASRYLRVITAGADGAIAFAGLPAGSYYAAAVATLPTDGDDAWQEPAYLESLVGRAVAFALGEGQAQVLNLKVGDR